MKISYIQYINFLQEQIDPQSIKIEQMPSRSEYETLHRMSYLIDGVERHLHIKISKTPLGNNSPIHLYSVDIKNPHNEDDPFGLTGKGDISLASHIVNHLTTFLDARHAEGGQHAITYAAVSPNAPGIRDKKQRVFDQLVQRHLEKSGLPYTLKHGELGIRAITTQQGSKTLDNVIGFNSLRGFFRNEETT